MQLVLAVGGAFIGGTKGFMIGWAIGSLLFPQKQPGQSVGKLNDLDVTGSGYGVMIPIVYGSCRVGGNVIWAQDLVEHSATHSEGGKGGGGVSVTEYSYTCSFAVAICEGPIENIKRIWAEDILLYDQGSWASGVVAEDARIYLGDETQVADTLIAGIEGATSTPANRGTAYVVFENLDLAKWGNRIPQLSFEVMGPVDLALGG